MNNSKRAIELILKHEGGYADHPRDPGGATNKGITIETFRRYIKPGGTKADLKALTTEQATVVYKRQYWDAVMGDYLPSGVDYAVADFAVNSGPDRAVKFLQRVVGAKPDGKVGPATLAAVEAMPAAQIINQLCYDRLAFLKRLSTWGTFGKGWSNRVNGVRSVALSWVGDEPAAPKAPPQPTGLVAAILALLAALFGKK